MAIVIDPRSKTVEPARAEGLRERLFSDCRVEADLVSGGESPDVPAVAVIRLPPQAQFPGTDCWSVDTGAGGPVIDGQGPAVVAALSADAGRGREILPLSEAPGGAEAWLGRILAGIAWMSASQYLGYLSLRDDLIERTGGPLRLPPRRTARLLTPPAVAGRSMTEAECVAVAAAHILPSVRKGGYLEAWVEASGIPGGVKAFLTGLGLRHHENEWFTPSWVGKYERDGRSLIVHDGTPRAEGTVARRKIEIEPRLRVGLEDVGGLLRYGGIRDLVVCAVPYTAENREAAVEIARSERIRAAGLRIALVSRDGSVTGYDPS